MARTSAHGRRCLNRANRPGLLYIVQTRHCIENHPTVFKAGRTKNMAERLRGYPKGTELIARVRVSRMKDAETMLMSLCHNRFTHRGDFGSEYFEAEGWDLLEALATAGRFFRVLSVPVAPVVTASEDEDEDEGSEDEESEWGEDEVMGEEGLAEENEDGLAVGAEHEDELPVGVGDENEDGDDLGVSDEQEADIMVVVPESDTIVTELACGKPTPRAFEDDDPSVLLIGFINSKLREFVQPVDTAMLLRDVKLMYKEAGKLGVDLKRHFGCTFTAQHPFEDGVRHATSFDVAVKRAEKLVKGVDGAPMPQFQMLPMTTDQQLNNFFAMSDDIRGCRISFVEGAITLLLDFKEMFEAPRNKLTIQLVLNEASFQSHGYKVSSRRVNTCKGCRKLHRVGCCEEYGRLHKSMKSVIYNMQLVRFSQAVES